jgi:hypothetical protein
MEPTQKLFSGPAVRDLALTKVARIASTVNSFPEEEVLHHPDATLAVALERLAFRPLVVEASSARATPQEVDQEVHVIFSVPVTGDRSLLTATPRVARAQGPAGTLEGSGFDLEARYSFVPDPHQDAHVAYELAAWVGALERWVAQVNDEARHATTEITEKLTVELRQRAKRLARLETIRESLEPRAREV